MVLTLWLECGLDLVNPLLTSSNTTYLWFRFGQHVVDPIEHYLFPASVDVWSTLFSRFLCGRAVMPTQQKSRSRSVSPTLPDAEGESPVAEVLALSADSRAEEAW